MSKIIALISPWRVYIIGAVIAACLAVTGWALNAAYQKGRAHGAAKAEAARLALEVQTHKRIAERQQAQFDKAAAQAIAEAQEAREAEDLIAARLKEIHASEKAAAAENSRLESQIAFLSAELTDATKDATRTEEERNRLNADIEALRARLNRCGLSDRDLDADRRLHHKGSRATR